jgi:hypothetical protein
MTIHFVHQHFAAEQKAGAPVKRTRTQDQKLKRACRSSVREPQRAVSLTKVWTTGDAVIADRRIDAGGVGVLYILALSKWLKVLRAIGSALAILRHDDSNTATVADSSVDLWGHSAGCKEPTRLPDI